MSTSTRGEGGDLPTVLLDQIEFHWTQFMRGRLEGLTDEEYLWDPTGDQRAWTVRPGGQEGTTIDFAIPEPVPAPFTTIAWRIGHIVVGVLAARSHSHHGGPPADYGSWPYAATAQEALDQLDREYARWIDGVRRWDAEDLQVAVGPAEGPFAAMSRATLVAHINRELLHHLAEIGVIRDLYAHRA